MITPNNQYVHHYSITAADMDTRYRMTPSAVLLYFQDCSTRFMACLHLAPFDVAPMNRIWIITEFNAWFEQQTALWSDDIEVTIWDSELTALRLYTEFRIRRSDGVEVAHGYGCWSHLDIDTHRLVPFTPFVDRIPIVPERTSESHKKRRFDTEGILLQQVEHRVNPINLDFNGHVNNRTYVSIAMQSAEQAFMDAYAIRCLSVHWLNESFLGDTLTCRLNLLPNDTTETIYHYLHSITCNDSVTCNDSKTAAQIYSEWIPRASAPDISLRASRC